MPQLSGIYDSEWIQPIARFKENISILSASKWMHFQVRYLEPMPPGPHSIIDMVTIAGATTLAANATIQRRVIAALQINPDEFLHLRFAPIDNVEALLWELAGVAKFNSKNMQARVDRNTRLWDPHYSLTTFGIYGMNRDMNLEIRNPMGYAIPTARVMFWGFRYLLEEIKDSRVMVRDPQTNRMEHAVIANLSAVVRKKLADGDREAVAEHIGPTTWFPAEGQGG